MADVLTPDDRALLAAIAASAEADPLGIPGEAIRAITAHMPALLVVIAPDGRMVWLNRTNPGVAWADVIGRSLYETLPPDEQPAVRETIDRVLQTGQPDRVAGHGNGRRGPRSRYEAWVAPIRKDGVSVAAALIARDVSEEWAVYEALRDREERLSIVLEAAGMGTWRFDLPSLTVELDERARAIYGVTEPRHASRAFTRARIHPEDQAAADQLALTAMTTRRPYAGENRIIRPDGQVRWVAITGSPLYDEQGKAIALLGTVTDVTARREYDARALQTQRLEAVGQLTAGIAHNFNNVLASIMPTLALLERDARPAALPMLRGAALAASRAADLVQQLMTFAGRHRRPVRTTERPATLVERTLQLCRSTFGASISLEVVIAPGLPAVHVDAGQIEQALLNLLLNARDALEHVARPAVTVRVGACAEPGPAVAIAIEDNGPGVPADARARMFDPFFTTKEVGRGTGLGLSTAYAIAREHGGSLRHEDPRGGGARFVLTLPALEADVGAEEGGAVASATPAVAPGPRGVVLVTDDDDSVRRAVMAVLESEGYEVLAAEDGAAAIAAVASAPRVDAVLLDLNMPGVPWRTVIDAIRSARPATRIIVYTGGVTREDGLADAWLHKPAGPDALLATLGRVLAGASPR